MGAYILRRLLLIIPTLFGIMMLNFVIIQFAPGGPVEQIIYQLEHGGESGATDRFTGTGDGVQVTTDTIGDSQGTILVYGDAEPGNPDSPIELKRP